MSLARALVLSCVLVFVLCQCRSVKAVLGFFHRNASKGHTMQSGPPLPRESLTWDQFVAANAGKKISYDRLQSRFRAADADDDGLLTREEVAAHHARAAANKARRQAEAGQLEEVPAQGQ